MNRERKKPGGTTADLPMTPMIDVVFQLLVFFLVALKPMDIQAHLDIHRPRGDVPGRPIQALRVDIGADDWRINHRPVSEAALDQFLREMGDLDPTQTVLILCSADAAHERLVKVLDLCARHGLTKLSVLSAP